MDLHTKAIRRRHSKDNSSRVGVVVVTWNSSADIPALCASLRAVRYSGAWKVFFVDNASSDRTREALAREAHGFAHSQHFNEENTGFAHASNQGAELAVAWGAEYLYFLNPDTEVDPLFLEEIVSVFKDDSSVGQAQSLLYREGGGRIQSWGNCITFLGFGYSGGDMVPADSIDVRDKEDIGYASGAGCMVPVSVWKEVGGFEELFESFHEDTALSLSIRLQGKRIVRAMRSRVIHKYSFTQNPYRYYLIERNRMGILLLFLKVPTIFLFLPAFIVMETGVLVFSFLRGFWKEKIRAYWWVFAQSGALMSRRRNIQLKRAVPDCDLALFFSSEIAFQELAHPLLVYVGNPFLRAYWRIVRPLIRW